MSPYPTAIKCFASGAKLQKSDSEMRAKVHQSLSCRVNHPLIEEERAAHDKHRRSR